MIRHLVTTKKTSATTSVLYICPKCSLLQRNVLPLGTQSSLAPWYHQRTRKGAANGSIRLLSKTTCYKATVSSHDPAHQHTLRLASLRSVSDGADSTQDSRGKSSIRDFLRKWSEQNEEEKRQNAPDTITAEGRITQLPNALFIRRDVEVDDTTYDVSKPGNRSLEEDFCPHSQLIKPGTLISFQGNITNRQYAVFIGHIGVQSLLALESGYWAMERTQTIRQFSTNKERVHIPNFLSSEELGQLRQHMPKAVIARPIGDGEAQADISLAGPISPSLIESFLDKMRVFRIKVEDYQREFARSSESIYQKVGADVDYRMMSVKDYVLEGAGLNYDSLEGSAQMAIVNQLSGQDFTTMMQTAEELSLLVIPKSMRHNFQQVVQWAREYQDAAAQAALGKEVADLLTRNPLTSFINKARQLIMLSRKLRSPTQYGDLGPYMGGSAAAETPLEKTLTGVSFSETDQMFIDFLWTMSFRIPRSIVRGPLKLQSTTSLILRAVGAYPDLRLQTSAGRLFLKEIGCVDPWTVNGHDLALPLPGGLASGVSDTLRQEVAAFEKQFRGMQETSADISLDRMSHVRTDWGNLPAFTIDPSNSVYPEDAISVQAAQDGKGYWIHVHVSHITAWFDRGSVIERSARNQGTSCFTIDASLPRGLVPAAINEYFSLKEGSAVLTVSTLLGDDGSVRDIKVQAGRVHNMVKLSKEAVEAVLGIGQERDSKLSVLTVGKMQGTERTTLTSHEIETVTKHKVDLEILNTLLQKRRVKREADLPEDVKLPRNSFDVQIQISQLETAKKTRLRESYHWKGDPGITLVADHLVGVETGVRRSQDIVAQAMRLASESIAQWFDDRQIPAVFLGTEAFSDNSFEKIARKQSHDQVLMPVFTRTSAPAPFWNIHMKSYCTITSPLRRYMDMLAMWQADSYLRAEANGLLPPSSPVQDHSILAFSRAEVDDYLRVDAHAVDTIESTVRAVRLNHVIHALFRAFHFNEAPLPSRWEVLITEPQKYSAGLQEQDAKGFLIPFGITCIVKPSEAGWEKRAKHGQFLPVTIESVEPHKGLVSCVAIGPSTDEQIYRDPIIASAEADDVYQMLTARTPIPFDH